jgi:hypothetical protein
VTARLRLTALLCAVAVVALACAGEEPGRAAFTGDLSRGNPTTTAVGQGDAALDAPDPTPLDAARQAELDAALARVPDGCEVLSDKNCLLPFPSDAHTVADPATGTQLRVDLPAGQLPNADGQTFDPTEWNRNDGWSPNTPILVHVPDLDADATNLPPQDDIAMSTTPRSSTVLVDLTTGVLVPHWAEVDLRATSPDDRLLIIRPAISLRETHRFAVGLRRMVGTNGAILPAPVAFQVFRDNNDVADTRISERQQEFNEVFSEMAGAGVDRSNLYLAWYFTVASEQTLASRLLSMRDDAFGALAGNSPEYTITSVRTDDLQPGIARKVQGTFEVPLYLDNGGRPGSRMVFNEQDPAIPQRVGQYTANFACVVPTAAVDSGEARPVVYGHGLLGSANEALSSHVQHAAAELNAVYCGTDWIGLAQDDVPNALTVLEDLSRFPSLPDRLQQGILNTLFLGRLMLTADGLGSSPEFQTDDGANMLNTDEAYYDGNSQGAIAGGAATAVAQDWTKASLGVGGMNYSLLLNRSVDFDRYFAVMRQAYPDPLVQQIWFGLIQMLWDRGETGGYVQHLTDDPYGRTPSKQVLMTVAFGDHQVATVSADNIARTLRIPVYQPVLPAGVPPYQSMNGLEPDAREQAFFELGPIRQFPLTGSALYYWYSGTLAPPLGNITPTESTSYQVTCTGPNAARAATDPRCIDPHEDPRRQPQVIAQKDAFFQPAGTINNVCRDEACRARTRADFPY